jgi:hypothetical protein
VVAGWRPDRLFQVLYQDEVAVMEVDGSNQQVLTQSGADTLPTWSRETNEIIFVTRRDATTSALRVISSHGGLDTAYIDNEYLWWDSEPEHAPFGDNIAFQSTRNGTWNIWVKTQLAVMQLTASPSPFSPNDDGHQDTTAIRFTLVGGAARLDLKVYDAANAMVVALLEDELGAAGDNVVTWDGRDRFGERVSDGAYTYRLTIPGSAGAAPIEHAGTVRVDTTPPTFEEWSIPDLNVSTQGPQTICVTVADSTEVKPGTTRLQYGIASAANLRTPDVIGWTDFGSGSCGTLDLSWSQYPGMYVFIRAYAEDVQGNVTYSQMQKQPISASAPHPTTVHLRRGFNLTAIPSEVASHPDLRNWLPVLGDADEIEQVMAYDSQAGTFVTVLPDAPANPRFELTGGEGPIVYATQNKAVTFLSAAHRNCPSVWQGNWPLVMLPRGG